MTTTAKVVSLIALAATIIPSFLFLAESISHDAVEAAALIGTIAWFLATPMWMGRDLPDDAKEVET